MIATKANMANEFLDKRFDKLVEDCEDLEIPFMLFKTNYALNKKNMNKIMTEAQNIDLLEFLELRQPFKITALEADKIEIEKEAKRRYNLSPNRT